MKFKGKLIGAILGYIIGESTGLFFGLVIGHLFDAGYFHAFFQVMNHSQHTSSQQIFFNNTFKIMGYVAKSDGRVSENEVQTARLIMTKMGLNETQKQEAIQLFTEGKQNDFNLTQSIYQLRAVCFLQPAVMQIFLDIQWQMATADGALSETKKAVLQDICNRLGVQDYRFTQSQSNYNQHQRRYTTDNSVSQQDAYETLGVSRNATPDEIKKAYRKLMSQNHPDKLIAKGLPPEMIKVATEKTQRIQKAYDQLKAIKGI